MVGIHFFGCVFLCLEFGGFGVNLIGWVMHTGSVNGPKHLAPTESKPEMMPFPAIDERQWSMPRPGTNKTENTSKKEYTIDY